MLKVSRRDVLKVVSGLIGGAAALRSSSIAQTPRNANIRIRKDVSTLRAGDPEIVALKKAVTKMKALVETDRRSWVNQAKIHGQILGDFGSCQHQNWFFLPWHRMYLFFFEDIVRKLGEDENFALPYWDWSRTHQLPVLFWGNGNPLDNPPRPGQTGSGRRPGLNPNSAFSNDQLASFVGLTAVSQVLNEPDYSSFGGFPVDAPGQASVAGTIESRPHNFVHRWVGGDMLTGGSPYDPIFWLHHCNVDRLWSQWMQKHPGQLPTEALWTDQRFSDFCDRDGQPASMVVSTTLSTRNLNYSYGEEVRPSIMLAGPPRKREVLASLTTVGNAEMIDSTANFTLRANAIQAKAFDVVGEGIATGQNGYNIRLILKDVKVPQSLKDQDVALQIHINCQKLGPDVPVSDPSYVSSVTFFDHGDHGHGMEMGTTSFQVNATPAFARLYADRTFREDEPLKVTIITKPLFPDDPNAPKSSVQELNPKQVSIQVIGPASG